MIHYVCLSAKFKGLQIYEFSTYLTKIDTLLRSKLNLKSDSDLEVTGRLLKENEMTITEYSIQVHGLNDYTIEIIRRKVEDILIQEFKPIHYSMINVIVAEYAGRP